MKLFLASEVKHPDTILNLKRFVGGFKGKKIAYIPTAANGEEAFGAWTETSDTWKLIQTFGAEVTPVQLEDYKNSSVIEALQNKDVLWFTGGYPGYLMYWVRRCELDKALPKLLEKSFYIGSSAGSMVTAINLNTTEWYFGETEPGASVIPGLGLVGFDIYPHYEESQYSYIKSHYKGHIMYLLKNGENIEVLNGNITVRGKERIIRK